MSDWVIEIIDRLSYAGVALLVALENVFPPIPSEIILPFAGFHSGQGKSFLVGMIVAATLGSLTGALILYWVARLIGPVRLRAIITRWQRWIRVTPADLDRAESWFDGHANAAVLICRCVPLIRSIVSIPAGFRRMNIVQFVVYTAIGSAIWNTVLISAGYVIGDNWHVVERYVGIFQYIVIAAILVAVAWFVWSRFLKKPARV